MKSIIAIFAALAAISTAPMVGAGEAFTPVFDGSDKNMMPCQIGDGAVITTGDGSSLYCRVGDPTTSPEAEREARVNEIKAEVAARIKASDPKYDYDGAIAAMGGKETIPSSAASFGCDPCGGAE